MTLQNRVTPLGELVAEPGRGLVYGNRGCLHDADGRIRRRFAGRRWIACRLAFRGWHRSPLLQPGRFTELFFLDEATAFAAGHRPCALCRRDDYNAFVRAVGRVAPAPARRRRDRRAAARRTDRGRYARAPPPPAVPTTSCRTAHSCCTTDVPKLVLGTMLRTWSTAGYGASSPRPESEEAVVITPPSLLSVLERGWDGAVPLLHPSASR